MSGGPALRPVASFETRRRVEFADTDMGKIVHFSRFFVFMETAEHQFLASLGAAIHIQHEGHEVGWPRVEASCSYHSPARYGDELDIRVEVERKGRRSMSYRFEFRVGDRAVATGRLASVCCVLDEPGGPRPIPIPDWIARQLAPAGDA